MSVLQSQEATQVDSPLFDDGQCEESEEIMSSQPLPNPWGRIVIKSADAKVPTLDLKAKDPSCDNEDIFNVYCFGRSKKNDLSFTSGRVSNIHCKIFCRYNHANVDCPVVEAWITDLSGNGTYVNNTRIVKNVDRQLHHGDVISLINPDLVGLNSQQAVSSEEFNLHSFCLLLFWEEVISFASINCSTMVTISDNADAPIQGINTVLRKERKIKDYYEIKEEIGKGANGQVFACVSKTNGKVWAVKAVKKNAESLETTLREAEMMKYLHHPMIIRLEDIFSDAKNLYFVMELSRGGDLFDRILKKKFYSEDEARRVMYSLFQGLHYMHSNNISHRDLKPENILLMNQESDVDVKISDFGLAKNANDGLKTFCGTPQYFAPEVLSRRESLQHHGRYTLQADIWSMGIILYVLICAKYPFSANDAEDPLQVANRAASLTSHGPWKQMSSNARDFLQSCLQVDPQLRITAEAALSHPWFTDLVEPATQNDLDSHMSVCSNSSWSENADITMIVDNLTVSNNGYNSDNNNNNDDNNNSNNDKNDNSNSNDLGFSPDEAKTSLELKNKDIPASFSVQATHCVMKGTAAMLVDPVTVMDSSSSPPFSGGKRTRSSQCDDEEGTHSENADPERASPKRRTSPRKKNRS